MFADLRYAARVLVQQPRVTLTAVAVLALALAANTGIFTIVNAALLRPLPMPDPDRLVMVWGYQQREGEGVHPVSVPVFAAWKARGAVFERIGASSDGVYSLTGVGDPVSISGYRFDADFFHVLGAQPVLGRTFLPHETTLGNHRVVVLSHALWRGRFNGDPQVIGRRVTLNDEPFTVIGVMPPAFHHPRRAELWTPLVVPARFETEWNARPLRVAARLKAGVTLDQAQREMTRIAADIARTQPASNTGEGVRLVPYREEMSGDVRPALLLLMGAAGAILLIACANLANLLLARTSARSTEMAIRTALGASRARLLRQLLLESALLGGAGAVLGLALTISLGDSLLAIFPNNIANVSIPRIESLPADRRVLAFTLALTVLATFAVGLLPARQSLRLTVTQRAATPHHTRFRRAMLVVEIALTFVLLVAAGLMLRSFAHVVQSDLGLDPKRVVAVQVTLPSSRYPNGPAQVAFTNAVVERLERLPGVEAAGATNFLPLSGFWGTVPIHPEGMPAPPPGRETSADNRIATPNYFETMRMRLVRGRAFTDRDTADQPAVAIVNESLARRFWPDADPTGRRLNLGSDAQPSWVEVVGVVADIKAFGQEEATHLDLYRPVAQVPFGLIAFTVRTTTDTAAMFAPIRQQIWAVDPQLPTFREDAMEALVAESTALRRISLRVLGGFAVLALLLAAVGAYGVLSYYVSQRRAELGIRVALGAGRTTILALVLGELGRSTLIGIVLGAAASIAAARLASTLLVGVTVTDPVVYATTCALLIAIAFAAGYLPARRAARVDPASVLRSL